MARRQSSKVPNKDEPKMADQLLKTVLRVPRLWLGLMLILIVLSMLDIVPSTGEIPLVIRRFHVEATTGLFLALIWLPSLVRLFAYAGGAVKTPVAEVSSKGLRAALLHVADNDSLGLLIERASRVEVQSTGTRREQAQELRQELEEVYAARVPGTDARTKLEELARQYDERRAALPPGTARTIELDAVVGGMLAIVSAASLSSVEVTGYLQSDDGGLRLVGLVAVMASGDVRHFSLVLAMIEISQSAFEQYYAVLAAQRVAPYLSTEELRKLRAAVLRQRDYDPAKHQYIAPGSTRWRLTDRLLDMISERV